MSLRVVTLGESMVQFNAMTSGPLRYVHAFERHGAGSESNVAVDVARLGLEAGWISRVGDDEFGHYLLGLMRSEGVDVSRVLADPGAPTGICFVQRDFPIYGHSTVFYYRSGSAASRMQPEDLDEEYLAAADAFHVSGITLAISESARRTALEAARVAKSAERLVSFDVNLRLRLWSAEVARPHVDEFIKLADILFVGEEEYRLLWKHGSETSSQILDDLRSRGPSTVILKRGEHGVVAAVAGGVYTQEAVPVQVVDKTGAGDALAAAVLVGILQGRQMQETLKVGAACAALVCTVKGDFEAMPTWDQAMQWSSGASNVLR